jgi:SAM-dependent methyltransferase
MYHWIVRPRWFTKKYIHDHIKNHFQLDNKIVLDFGSGTGANCCLCHQDHYLGIEPDVQRVELAKRLYPRHSFMIFDEECIPAKDDSIDYVVIVAVLHHLSDEQIKKYLLEFKRVLKADGKIIVMEPCLCNNPSYKNRFMNWYDDGDYIRNEDGYLKLFLAEQYQCHVYNEIFLVANQL